MKRQKRRATVTRKELAKARERLDHQVLETYKAEVSTVVVPKEMEKLDSILWLRTALKANKGWNVEIHLINGIKLPNSKTVLPVSKIHIVETDMPKARTLIAINPKFFKETKKIDIMLQKVFEKQFGDFIEIEDRDE